MKANKVIGTILVAGMLSGCSYMGEKYNVYFDTGSDKLSMAGKAELKKALMQAKKEDKKIKLSGYTDSTGSKKINKQLSRKRIAVVNKELVKMGLLPKKISTKVRGEGLFDKKGVDKKLRRVELSVY